MQTGEHLSAPTIQQRINVIKQHLHLSVNWKGKVVGINEMRRHYTNYLKGLPNIKEFRLRLVTLNEPELIDEVLDEIIEKYGDYRFQKSPIQLINYHEKCAV
jgi:tRNA-dihydrouridine synthase